MIPAVPGVTTPRPARAPAAEPGPAVSCRRAGHAVTPGMLLGSARDSRHSRSSGERASAAENSEPGGGSAPLRARGLRGHRVSPAATGSTAVTGCHRVPPPRASAPGPGLAGPPPPGPAAGGAERPAAEARW